MLLEAGANTDAARNDGFTPMMIAAQKGHVEVIKMLLADGDNKDAANKNGSTPMIMATANGHARS